MLKYLLLIQVYQESAGHYHMKMHILYAYTALFARSECINMVIEGKKFEFDEMCAVVVTAAAAEAWVDAVTD